MAQYPPPLDSLLTLGQGPLGDGWPDYRDKGVNPEHIPDLIRMATDPELNQGDPGRPEVWAPVHAWRALGQLRAEAAVEPLLGLLRPSPEDEYEPDDYAKEELPRVFALIGPAALPALEAALQDEARGTYDLIAISEAIQQIGVEFPECRDRCVATLTRKLEDADKNDPGLNGFIIDDLMRLRAVESAPVIERAFAAERVDVTVAGDWHDVFIALGLDGTPPPSTGWRERMREEFAFLDRLATLSKQSGRGPVADHRKARNRARKKMEKKSRQQRRKRGR